MTEQNERFLAALSNRILYLCQLRRILPEKIIEDIHMERGREISPESLLGIHTDEIYKVAEALGVEADFLLGKPSGYTAEVEYIMYLLKRKEMKDARDVIGKTLTS